MNPFYIYFTQHVPAGDPGSYVTSTLRAVHAYYASRSPGAETPSASAFDEMAKLIASRGNQNVPALVDPQHWATPGKHWAQRIDRCVECALSLVAEIVPLFSGEEVLVSEHSYLSADWEGFGRGCGVIRRRTNLSTMYILFPNTMISDTGELNRIRSVYPDKPDLETGGATLSSAERHLSAEPFDLFVLTPGAT